MYFRGQWQHSEDWNLNEQNPVALIQQIHCCWHACKPSSNNSHFQLWSSIMFRFWWKQTLGSCQVYHSIIHSDIGKTYMFESTKHQMSPEKNTKHNCISISFPNKFQEYKILGLFLSSFKKISTREHASHSITLQSQILNVILIYKYNPWTILPQIQLKIIQVKCQILHQ